MSADLLDLDSFYQSPPPQQQQTGAQQSQSQQKPQQRPQQATASSTDLFDFASFTNKPAAAASPAQQTQPWPNLETQQPSGTGSGSNGGWGDLSSLSSGFTSAATTHQPKQMQQAIDDDDGWGDFEVAAPTPTQQSFVLPPQTNKARSSPPPRNRIARASTFDLISNNLVNVVDMPRGSGLSPIPSPGFPPPNHQPAPSPGLSWQQPNGQSSSGFAWQTASTNAPGSPGFSFQTSSAKLQSGPGFSGQMYGSQRKPNPESAKQSDPNVLFDAEDFELQGDNDDEEEEDDDDFGDFESVQTPFPGANMSPTLDSRPAQRRPPQAPQPPPSMDLLSLDDDPIPVSQPPPKKPQLASLNLTAPTSPYPQAPKSPSFRERNPFPGLGLTTPTSADFPKEEKTDGRSKSPTPLTAWPSFGQTSPKKPSAGATKKSSTTVALHKPQKEKKDEEDWPDFEDFPDDEPSAVDSAKPPESWDWDAVDGVKPAVPSAVTANKPAPKPKAKPEPTSQASEVRDDAPPPINIPPPSVLLSIFPQLLDLANSSLFKPTGQMAAPIRKRILSDPGTVVFLRAYLLLATVAARIIAGRKLRWHRDKFLAQGMAISAAGAKGMKLAGVDKAQAAREDRETADVVGVWKEHVGRLRSAVAAANSTVKTPHDQLRVPEINETIPVSTAKVVPTAPKACIICGLKRDERVSRVDFDVEDSFGEWWVEHWGHRACKNFWVEHEKQLRPEVKGR